MRILRPADNVYAFYDGRLDDEQPALDGAGEEDGWLERGALSLGVASYALVDGEEALVYDTHASLDRAEAVRRTLGELGVRKITVLLSHWHLDHVAGAAVFADCEILAGALTHERLVEHRAAIESGTLWGPPAIAPLMLPTRLLAGRTTMRLGSLELELIPFDIHSDDATVVWLPERRLLLAADTVEDPVTYVTEPHKLEVHLSELDRLAALGAERILPSHGDEATIAAGGYDEGLIRATQEYIRALIRIGRDPRLREAELRELLAAPLAAGSISYYAPYERVHHTNLRSVLDARA